MRTVALTDGVQVPALGQGTWRMGEGARTPGEEADALRQGIDLGMTLIDTAEMYADGDSERVVGAAIAGQRDGVFVVSKVSPQHAGRRSMAAACEGSLQRLGTDRLDLYLLHWRGGIPLAETVAAFEALRTAGKILRWGVSNFDVDDLAQLGDAAVGANQVLYSLDARGIEFDLLPWCAAQGMPVMAYSPVGQGGALLQHPVLTAVGAHLGATPAQVALAWTLRLPGVISIPKASDPAHVAANAAAAEIALSDADLTVLDAVFPPPRRREPLGML